MVPDSVPPFWTLFVEQAAALPLGGGVSGADPLAVGMAVGVADPPGPGVGVEPAVPLGPGVGVAPDEPLGPGVGVEPEEGVEDGSEKEAEFVGVSEGAVEAPLFAGGAVLGVTGWWLVTPPPVEFVPVV